MGRTQLAKQGKRTYSIVGKKVYQKIMHYSTKLK